MIRYAVMNGNTSKITNWFINTLDPISQNITPNIARQSETSNFFTLYYKLYYNKNIHFIHCVKKLIWTGGIDEQNQTKTILDDPRSLYSRFYPFGPQPPDGSGKNDCGFSILLFNHFGTVWPKPSSRFTKPAKGHVSERMDHRFHHSGNAHAYFLFHPWMHLLQASAQLYRWSQKTIGYKNDDSAADSVYVYHDHRHNRMEWFLHLVVAHLSCSLSSISDRHHLFLSFGHDPMSCRFDPAWKQR